MVRCITGGNLLSTYRYIGYVIFFTFVKDISFGSHNVEYFKDLRILDSGPLNNCYFIHQIFCYLVTIIWGFIAYNKENRFISRNSIEYSFKKLENKIKDNQTLDIELIHNEQELKDYPNKYLFIIISIWVVNEEILNYYNSIFMHLDFWMIELIIITYLMVNLLNLKIYSHQRLMMGLTLIPFIIKVVTIILSYLDESNELNKEDETNYQYSKDIEKLKVIYVADKWLIVWFLLYIILIAIRSYVNTKVKWLIDLKYISLNKILIIYGIVGSIFCLVISLVSTFISCGEFTPNRKEFFEYFCTVEYGNEKFLESFKTYFLSEIEKIKIVWEMLKVIVGIASFIGYRIFFLKTIENLTPIHLIFAFPLHYLINKTYLSILNVIKNDGNALIDIEYNWVKYGLDYSSDVFSIIGYLIFLEIIELHFCKLDYYLRRKILARGIIDVYKADPNNTSESGSEIGRQSSAGQISTSSLNDSDF